MRAIFPTLLILTLCACGGRAIQCHSEEKDAIAHYAYEACKDNPHCLLTADDVFEEQYRIEYKCIK